MSGEGVHSNAKQYAPDDKVYLLVATTTVTWDWDKNNELFDVAVVDDIYERIRNAPKDEKGKGPWARIDGYDDLVGIRTYGIKYKHLSPIQKEMLKSGKYPVHYV